MNFGDVILRSPIRARFLFSANENQVFCCLLIPALRRFGEIDDYPGSCSYKVNIVLQFYISEMISPLQHRTHQAGSQRTSPERGNCPLLEFSGALGNLL